MQYIEPQNLKEYAFYTHDPNTLGNLSNYISENTLHNHFNRFRNVTDLTDPVMKYISTSNPSLASAYGGIFDYLKSSMGYKSVDTMDYTWSLKRRAHTYVRNEENLYVGVDYPAKGKVKLRVKLSHGFIKPGTYIWPENRPELQCIVETVGMRQGHGFIYEATKNKKTNFFPKEMLKPGTRWCVSTGVYSEGSNDYAAFYMGDSGRIEFKGTQWSFGQSYEVTDMAVHASNAAASNKTLIMEGPNPVDGGEPITAFLTEVEATSLAWFEYSMKNIQWLGEDFGKESIDSSSGLHRRTAIGLRPLLRYGHRLQYVPGTSDLKMLRMGLNSYWDARISFSERSLTANGGSAIITWFSDILNDAFRREGYVQDMRDFTKDGGPTYAKGYTGKIYKTAFFTEWMDFPRGNFKILWEPFFDDEQVHGSMRFEGSLVSSYEGVVFNGAMGPGFQENIRLIQIKNGEVFTAKYGTYSPAGGITDGLFGKIPTDPTLGRKYIVVRESRRGLYMNDVTLPITMSLNARI